MPPVLRCFKCQRFGHGINTCRSKLRCVSCGEGHDWQACPNKTNPKCARCGEAHSAAYLGCKDYIQAKKIQAYKLENKISFGEAARQLNKNAASIPPPPRKQQEARQLTTKNAAPTSVESAPKTATKTTPPALETLPEARQKNRRNSSIPIPKNKNKNSKPQPCLSTPMETTQSNPPQVNSECQTDSPPPTTFNPDNFLALIAFIINNLEEVKNSKSNGIKLVVDAAQKCCGISISPTKIHSMLTTE